MDGSFTPGVKPLDIKNVGGAAVSAKTSRRVRQSEILLFNEEGSTEVTCHHTLWMAVQTNDHLPQKKNPGGRCDDATSKCQRDCNQQSAAKTAGRTGQWSPTA